MANILLVEDSYDIKEIVFAVLQKEHVLEWAPTLAVGQKILLENPTRFDLVLLDIDLPDGSGIDFMANLHRSLEDHGVGVIFLTGTNTVSARTRSFTLGALDFIAKPFDIFEFQVRVNAKLKGRTSARTAVQNIIRRGHLEIDLSKQQAFDHSEESPRLLDLTPVEFKLLLLFLQNSGEVVSRQSILQTVWGPTAHVSSRCVDHHICGLRKKISHSGSRIESIYGVGYRIEA